MSTCTMILWSLMRERETKMRKKIFFTKTFDSLIEIDIHAKLIFYIYTIAFMNWITRLITFLLFHLLVATQTYRTVTLQQLLAVDIIKNDSIALITLEQLVKK